MHKLTLEWPLQYFTTLSRNHIIAKTHKLTLEWPLQYFPTLLKPYLRVHQCQERRSFCMRSLLLSFLDYIKCCITCIWNKKCWFSPFLSWLAWYLIDVYNAENLVFYVMDNDCETAECLRKLKWNSARSGSVVCFFVIIPA